MSSVVQRDIGVWMATVPLIHFWISSHYYLDRVMRQFIFFQYIPPPAPLSWNIHLKLDNVDHTSKKYAQIGGVIGWFMLMSGQILIIGWYILRVCMISGSGRTTCSGMRVSACGLYFLSATLSLIWINRDQYHQSWSVLSHMSLEVISLLGRFKKFNFLLYFLIKIKTACN
jgi:hypothetical protein